MAKCMLRWMDPLIGKTTTPLGPFSCGRTLGHRGVHAHDGNGASALWRGDGTLVLAIQTVRERATAPVKVALALPVDADVAELLASSIDVDESGGE